MFESIAK